MADGVRLAVSLVLPDGDGPFAVAARGPALPQGRPHRRLPPGVPAAGRRGGLRGLPGRPAGDRLVGAATRPTSTPTIEQQDLAEVIAWLAAQPWSNGRVGMFGTSYSGFNSHPDGLRAAAGAPRHLRHLRHRRPLHRRRPLHGRRAAGHRPRRLLPLHDADERAAAGPRGVRRRLAGGVGPPGRADGAVAAAHGCESNETARTGATASLRPDYGRIRCATLLVGGWADGYRNNSFRTFAALQAPKALLMGPWSHMSTETSLPGPHIDLVPEMIRWFGH